METCTEVVIKIHEENEDESMSSPLSSPSDSEETEDSDSVTVIPVPNKIPIPVPTIDIIHIDIGSNEDNSSYSGASIEEFEPKGKSPSQTQDDKIQGVEKNSVDRDHCYSRGSTSKIEERKGGTKARDDSGGIKIKDEGKKDEKDRDRDRDRNRDRKRELDRDLHRGQGSYSSGGIKIKDEEKKERKDRDRHRNRSRDRGDSESIKIKEEKPKERRKHVSPGVTSKDKDNVDAFGRTIIRDQTYSRGRRSSPTPTYSSAADSGRRRKESRSPDRHRRIDPDRGRSSSRVKISRRRSKSPSTSRSICSINRDRRSRHDNRRSRSRSGSPSYRHRRYLHQRSRSRSRSRSSPKEYDYYRNRRIYRSKSKSRTRSPPKYHKIKKEIKPNNDFASMRNRKEQEKRQSLNENSASLTNPSSTSFLEASFVQTKQEKIDSNNHNTENIMIFYEKLQAQAKGKWTEELEIRWHLRLVEEARLTAGRPTDIAGKIPEDHPLYASEWEKFWKCRYQQVQDIQMDAKTHDFTSEWKIYWDTLSADVSHRHQSQQRQPTTSTTVSDPINYNGPPASASATIMSVPPTFVRALRHEPFPTGNFVQGHAVGQNQFTGMMSVPVPVPMSTPTPTLAPGQQLPPSFHDYGHGSGGSCAGVDFDVKAAYPSSSYSTSTQPPVPVTMSANILKVDLDNDECNVVRELRRMLDLEAELSFLSRQVQHYYVQAQQMDMMQSRGSLAMLKNTEFVHLLFKCRDRFFAVLRANVCSRDEMKKLNLAVFGLNNLLNSPLCENIRPPAPSPVPAAVPDLAFAPAPLPSSAEMSRSHQPVDIFQPLQNNLNLFPQAAPSTRFKAEDSTPTLAVKTEVVDVGSLCIDTNAESSAKLLLDNPIPSALRKVSDSAKIELSTIIAGALIAQGKERDKKRNRMRMRAGDLLPKLLSIFGPVVLNAKDGGSGGSASGSGDGNLKVEVPTGSGSATDSAFAYDRIPRRDRVASMPMSMSMSTSNQSFIESETRPTIATPPPPPPTTSTLAHSPPESKPKVPLKPFMLISAKANEIHPIPPLVEITARAASPPLPGVFKHAKKYPKPLAFISSKASEISAIPPLPEYTARAASPPSEKDMLKKFLRKRQNAESDPRRGEKWGRQSPSSHQDNFDNSIKRDRDVRSRERSSRRSISVSKSSRNSRSLSPSLLEPVPTYDIKDEDLIVVRRGSHTDLDRDRDRGGRRQEHERENVKHEKDERHCSSGSIDNPITIGDRALHLYSDKHVKIPGAPKIWMPPSDLSTVSSESSFEFIPGSNNGDRDRGLRPMYRENKENGGQRHFDSARMNSGDPRRSSTRGDIRIVRNPHFVKSEKIKMEKSSKSKTRKSDTANSSKMKLKNTTKVKPNSDPATVDGDGKGDVKEEGEAFDPDMEDGEILSDSETDFSDDNSEVCPMTPPRPVSVLSYASDVSEDWEKGIFFYPR